jgi:hypothetical protein
LECEHGDTSYRRGTDAHGIGSRFARANIGLRTCLRIAAVRPGTESVPIIAKHCEGDERLSES